MSNKLKENFLKDFQELLSKYEVAFFIENHYTGYTECGEDNRISIEFRETYDDIDCGRFIDKDNIER